LTTRRDDRIVGAVVVEVVVTVTVTVLFREHPDSNPAGARAIRTKIDLMEPGTLI
jgi:hypothetical protein